jgi:hypothetical protein
LNIESARSGSPDHTKPVGLSCYFRVDFKDVRGLASLSRSATSPDSHYRS